jgi:PAS domain S-box-containing protein
MPNPEERTSILIVDDSPKNLLALQAILAGRDYRLVAAESGREALRHLAEETFAVVLLDVMMPEMDGFEVARRAKGIARNMHTPIIFVTAMATDSRQVTKAYANGAAEVLLKPLDAEEVCAKVALFVDLFRLKCELERAEARTKELAAGNERFRLFVEGVQEYGFIQLDPEGRFTAWNAGAEQLLGYRETEIIGQPFARIFTPEDVEADAPARELLTARSQGYADDARWHRRKDGSRFWAHGITTALCAEDGRVRGFAKVMRDYTGYKAAEDALRSLPASVCYIDQTRCHRFANRTYEEWFGLDPAAIQGKQLLDVFGAEVDAQLSPQLELALDGTRVSCEAKIRAAGGDTKSLRVIFTPDQTEGVAVRGVVGLMLDLDAATH